jgi:hypothetical protein
VWGGGGAALGGEALRGEESVERGGWGRDAAGGEGLLSARFRWSPVERALELGAPEPSVERAPSRRAAPGAVPGGPLARRTPVEQRARAPPPTGWLGEAREEAARRTAHRVLSACSAGPFGACAADVAARLRSGLGRQHAGSSGSELARPGKNTAIGRPRHIPDALTGSDRAARREVWSRSRSPRATVAALRPRGHGGPGPGRPDGGCFSRRRRWSRRFPGSRGPPPWARRGRLGTAPLRLEFHRRRGSPRSPKGSVRTSKSPSPSMSTRALIMKDSIEEPSGCV